MTGSGRLVWCVAVLGVGLPAQGDGSRAGPEQVPRFTTRAEAVRVDVLVTDRGRLVRGLTAQDFELRDEGVLQRIDLVDELAEPLNLVCLIDTGYKGPSPPPDVPAGWSIGPAANPLFQYLIDAGNALLDALQPHDRVSLIAFSNRFRLLSTLTTDHAAVKSTLRTLYPGGATAWRDAVFAGLVLRHGDPRRTLLLLFSHGGGWYDWLTRSQLVDAARRTDAVVYAVTFRLRGAPWDYHPVLDDLADETGGRVVITKGGRDLSGVFVNVLAEFRSRYVLAYIPTGVPSGGWHRLDVALKGRPGGVKARRGYFAE